MQNGIGIHRIYRSSKNIFSVCLKVSSFFIICFYIVLAHAVNEEDYKAETLSEEGSLLAQALNEEDYSALQESTAAVRNGMNPQMVKLAGGFFISKNLLVTNYRLIEDLVDANDRSTFSEAMVEVITPRGVIDIGMVLAVDPKNDLAILKTLENSHKPLEMGSDRDIVRDETIFTFKDLAAAIQPKDSEKIQDIFLERSIENRIGNETFYYSLDNSPTGGNGLPVFSEDLKVVGMVSLIILESENNSVFVIPVSKLKNLIEENRELLEREGFNQVLTDRIEEVPLDLYVKTPEDMFHLGLAYERSIGGVSQDLEKAIYWYTKAGNQGHADANFQLAYIYMKRNEVSKGFERLEMAARSGHLNAKYQLATAHYSGEGGIDQDLPRAFESFKEIAESGHRGARFMVALMQYHGQGIGQDLEKAFQGFKSLAAEGDMNSTFMVASMRYHGQGTVRDPKKAFKEFELLAARGDVRGLINIAWMRYQGRYGITQNVPKAFTEFQWIAQMGLPEMRVQVGLMLYFGIGVSKDLNQAFYWFEQAAMQGDPNGAFQLARMYKYGESVPKDLDKARYWYEKSRGQKISCSY